MSFCPCKGFLPGTFAVCHEVSVACISEEACGSLDKNLLLGS